MTTYDLMLKVKETLDEAGFETKSAPTKTEYESQGSATKDGKSWWEEVEGYNFKHLNGYEISFQIVYRSNATEENKSVDVKIYNWKNSSGYLIEKERLNVNYSEKQIQNRLKKIIDKYNEL